MKLTLLSPLLLALSLSLASTHAGNNPGTWKRLGQKEASLKADRDEVVVGADEGVFKAIKLQVLKADVEFISVRVVYASGEDQQIELRKKVHAGGESRPLDLDGRNRVIRKVVFVYRSNSRARKQAVVVLFGRR